MLFNSYVFLLVFLPGALAGCFLLARRSATLAAYWLLAASLVFYGAWDVRYVPLLLASIAFNYLCGERIAAGPAHARALLWLGVGANLALLGCFKYAGFFVDTANGLLGAELRVPGIVLPLGISFYTFTQIAYLVDVYHDPARYGFGRYALFVSYFPHLIAGPILHHREMMPQFAAPTAFRAHAPQLAAGLTLFAIGLFKKTVLADGIAPYASPLFDHAGEGYAPGFAEAWAGVFAYGLQLYFDFSAYSDMAVGLSAMLGIRMPANFDSPYRAFSLIEFWRRWHITLSRFLRSYLYIPLGGNRKGPLRRYANLLVTMVLGGLWHGAGWTFLAWGAVHGAGLAINHLWRGMTRRLSPFPAWLRGVGGWAGFSLTTCFVFAAWVLFRSPDLASAKLVYRGMLGLNGNAVPTTWIVAVGDAGRWLAEQNLGLPLAARAWIVRNVASFDSAVPRALADVTTTGVLVGTAHVAWIAALLAVAWFAPNSMRIMARTPVFLDRAADAAAGRCVWQPSLAWALGSAAMLFVAMISMTRISEFLYFQF
jgi:D-alanyl-lipoteichoic acid acyltransferase DltB (MBOAT superfamily)